MIRRPAVDAVFAEDVISCEERDRIILRIAEKHGFTGYSLSTLAGYGRSKREVMELATHRKTSAPWSIEQDESYVSLTKIAQTHSEDSPRYAIQSWLRSGNTLAFLNLWEKENNPDYGEAGYIELLEKKKTASFSQTPKLWIDRTKAIGMFSKQGKSGGTFAHPMIACEFALWLTPEFKMLLLKLSLNRDK